jgi:chromosome partitioning protein
VVTTQDGPDLLPANLDLAGAETVLLNAIGKETVLREVIGRFRGQYDWILLDAPPSLGILTINILAASDALCVPMQCEYYALEGLSQLIKTVELVRRRIHPPLTIATVVLTMHDPRSRLTAEVEAEVRKFFGDKVAETRIPRNVRLSEAPGHGKSAVALFPQSKGAEAYAEFAQEVVALAASGAR